MEGAAWIAAVCFLSWREAPSVGGTPGGPIACQYRAFEKRGSQRGGQGASPACLAEWVVLLPGSAQWASGGVTKKKVFISILFQE